ncbi:MAG: UDP-N-acetylmuramoyl-L-alanyl-D-glutamate--2,6-diaminopimelate ligase [Marinilabiliales bacterium]|nr:MAG: UDP-N-acetylmuramoyl-L-alanyl-D-glutamate--2,6-diaminopimelate ligase [Marinilabiliales bacterium]
MMLLSTILKDIKTEHLNGPVDLEIAGMSADSRQISEGFLFLALSGTQVDGHQFIDKAVDAGAVAIVCSRKDIKVPEHVTVFYTENAHQAYALASSNFYGRPANNLKVIGITGTNGKTTTVTLLANLFNACGIKSGLLSTVRYQIAGEEFPASHTTPDALHLNELLALMVEKECEYCFMEVSSHALIQERVAGIDFAGAVFSNITQDHLDYHGTFQDYINAKQILFNNLSRSAFALYNADDKNGHIIVQNTHAKKFTYALKKPADFKSRIIENHVGGLALNVDGIETWFRLPGRFNAYNLTAVYACAVLLGMEKDKVLRELSKLDHIDGRFNLISSNRNVTGIVDYAHTPDALKNVLETVVDLNNGNGRIICVAGAGGDRDPSKRPQMGKIMAHFADLVIITSDNPRSENPQTIIDEVKEGIDITRQKKVLSIESREEAIRTACMMAQDNDIILLAGKGHETYQEINGVRNHFDDREMLYKYLNE